MNDQLSIAEAEYRVALDADITLLSLQSHPDGETGSFTIPDGGYFEFAYTSHDDSVIAVEDEENSENVRDFAIGYLDVNGIGEGISRNDAYGFLLGLEDVRLDKKGGGGKCGSGWTGSKGSCKRAKKGKMKKGRGAAFAAGAGLGAAGLAAGAAGLGAAGLGAAALSKTEAGKKMKESLKAEGKAANASLKSLGRNLQQIAKDPAGGDRIQRVKGALKTSGTELNESRKRASQAVKSGVKGGIAEGKVAAKKKTGEVVTSAQEKAEELKSKLGGAASTAKEKAKEGASKAKAKGFELKSEVAARIKKRKKKSGK